MKNINTPYDDVFRILLNDCTELIIPVVNEIFGENYTGKEKITFSPNEHFLNQQDGNTKEKITDSCFVIQGAVCKKYHIECQSTPDGSLLIRFFEYDSQIALDDGEVIRHHLKVTFPHSAVLYLRHNSQTPDALTVEISTPGGSVTYEIPVLKTQKYSIEEIFEKHMLFLIPFYIFSYEKELREYNNNVGKMRELKQRYQEIRNRLEMMCAAEEISEYTKCAIIDMSNKVVENLTARYSNVREGVKAVMGGKVLDYEAKDILKQGIRQGLEEGLLSLVRDGLLSVEEAARRLQMSESEFEKLLKQ